MDYYELIVNNRRCEMRNRIVLVIVLVLSVCAYYVEAADVSTHVLGAKKRTLSASTDTVQSGYYAATTLSTVDGDLSAGNIKKDVVIFGKTGTYLRCVPDTGQPTPGYTDTTGEDCDYNPSATQMSYTDNGNTVTDNLTGLMWVENGTSSGCYDGNTRTWEQAIAFCENLVYSGYSDWRLPNVKELFSIVEYHVAGTGAPYINQTRFLNTVSSYYWTSTTYVPNTDYAMSVRFSTGIVDYDYKTNGYYVRPVRAGP